MQDLDVIDFETTGLTPGIDRPTEVAIVIVRGREVVDAFSRLMNPAPARRWRCMPGFGAAGRLAVTAS